MALVKIPIRGKIYELSCDDGQEGHLLALAKAFEQRAIKIASQSPGTHDVMTFLMAGIMLADELYEMEQEAEWLRAEAHPPAPSSVPPSATPAQQAEKDREHAVKVAEIEAAVAQTIEDIAARVERVAEMLENR